MSEDLVIEMRNITKAFGNFKANDQINLQVRRGEIHALLGENGAGKSTLMNILSGNLEPTEGQILINGQEVNISSPSKAKELGIGMVHQHFMLVDDFTVTENIMLGNEVAKNGVLQRDTADQIVNDLSERYNLFVDSKAKVVDISVGMQQRVEIIKTLYLGAEILILDEPTAVLTPQEIDELIKIMKMLVDEGKSIVLITHKLDEIMAVADRCTVIRRGKSIDTVNVATSSPSELANLMVGRQVNFTTDKIPSNPKEEVLVVKNLNVNDSRHLPAVNNLSFNIRAGEVLGIAGIDGNGQSELISAITGLRKVESGTISINGQDITNQSPRTITETGIGHIPEDRQKHGLVLNMEIKENAVLQSYYHEPFSKKGIINPAPIEEYAKRIVDEYDVRTTSIYETAGSLSGGNQQKLIIAREMDRKPKFLIAAQPTRGLDVGAIDFIHSKIIEARDEGAAVLLMSFELDEIMNLSDRIIVMFHGQIQGEVLPQDTNEQELGLLMAGSQSDRKESGEVHE